MPTVTLTDITIKNLKPPVSGQVTYFATDKSIPGFGMRVSSGGIKAFVLVHGRGRTRTSLGRYPVISLQEARGEAKRILAERTLGKHQAPRMHFEDAFTLFIENHCKPNNTPRSAANTEGCIRKHFLPSLRLVNLEDIRVHDIMKVLDRLLARELPSAANHSFTALRTMLRYCVKRQLIPHSPLEGLGLPTRAHSRTRVLSPAELRQVWHAARDYEYPFGTIVQVLILTGQRRGEIGALRADYLNPPQTTITLPSQIVKNKRSHLFPYDDRTAAIVETLPAEGYLFPARGEPDHPFSGWSKAKGALECTVEDWGLHDLRRTFATIHAEIGTPPHVIERLLNHASGQISGVAAIYNKYQYLPEMRLAAARYEGHVAKLVQAA